MRVCILPTYQGADKADGGIRRVVEAQQQYLPELGIAVTNSPDDADLIACHGAAVEERPGVPLVVHSHGMMWAEYGFGEWGDKVNKALIDGMIRAQAITAPSRWVAHAISRGMLVTPEVIYHGVDADGWQSPDPHLGYVLWNKARVDQVSDPYDMNEVAKRLPDVPFLSTFGHQASNVMRTGPLPHEQMRTVVQHAAVYLATPRETFGIGTLEALAAGVPVVGWRYGGQEEIITDGETGYLAEYGDFDGLAQAIRACLSERGRFSRNCIEDARTRWSWQDKIAQYAALYKKVYEAHKAPRPRVSVIITAYNLAQYLPDALKSVVNQTMTDWECLVIDDCSTDDPKSLIPSDPRFQYLRTPHNLKLSGARNFGFSHANGKYVLFLDADDELAPNALDVLSQSLDRDTATHIAYGHLDVMNDAGEERRRNPWPGPVYSWHGQIAHLNQLPYAAMLRREVLERSGGFRSRDWRAEDAAFWARVTSFGFRAAKVTEDSTLIYRLRSTSKSRGEDSDGDWTAWLPFRLAGDPHTGERMIEVKAQPNAQIVPFGAQGQPPTPLKCWPVKHHQDPAVSVIIPVGPGHARYLVDALDSLTAQTCPDWEAIVVNDTGAPLDLTAWPWAREMEFYSYNPLAGSAWEPGPKGAGAARNVGLNAARAPLCLFLDADDFLHPKAIERLLEAYPRSHSGYVYSDWISLEDEGKWDGPIELHRSLDWSLDTIRQAFIHPVTALVSTAQARAVGGFDETMDAWEDWDFFVKLSLHGVCGTRVPEGLLIYRLKTGQRREAALKQEQKLLALIRERYQDSEVKMCGCQGNGAALNAARTALEEMLPGDFSVLDAPAAVQPEVVRMEFIGDTWGAQTYKSRDGQRAYRGGRDPSERYADVLWQDVSHLEALGVWRRVELPPDPLDPDAEAPIGAAPLAPRRGRSRMVQVEA